MSRRGRRSRDAELELTPLIDVVFLLLVFFMVSTTFIRETRLQIELPEAVTAAPATSSAPIEVLISRDGSLAVGEQRLIGNGRSALAAALRSTLGADVERSAVDWPPLVIVADAGAAHENVVLAMDVAGEIGFEAVRIATRMQELAP